MDIYIKCAKGVKIFHYGRDVLQIYVPSIKRGNNILNKIEQSIVFDIERTDFEVLFKIKDRDLNKIIDILQPQTSGANISPFSSKNLPKRKESVLSSNQIEVYRSVIEKIPKDDKLVINQLNRLFLNNYVTKKLKLSSDEISAEMKKEQLKIRDYIYYKGFEKEYLDFLQKEISSRYECEN